MTIHLALTCGSQREISNALPSNGVRTATVRFYRRQPCLWLNHYELLHQHAVVVNQRKVGFPADILYTELFSKTMVYTLYTIRASLLLTATM
ncbi:hypothetical protein QR680_000790 [Steinernema hermaphroditum]|uniref:Uncharacterized protein n=1 Tax=Steinernema hermaphroditum TaxID=289476 RepID=A0AA39GXV5_9BILA|nr:hypothetical protein QR680_000790 [Steinernema hermaphroditum]